VTSRYKRFKGTPAEYSSLHHWVAKQLGRPVKCEHCKTTESKRYEWANISGKYKRELSDWVRLCKRCHVKMDGAAFRPKDEHLNWNGNFCKKGHEYTEANTYTKTQTSKATGRSYATRICIKCQYEYHEKFRRQGKYDYAGYMRKWRARKRIAMQTQGEQS